MKQQFTRLLLIIMIGAISFSDAFAGCPITILPGNGSTSGNARAPMGNFRFIRGVYLVTAAEIAAQGFVPGQVIGTIGWNFSTAASVPVSGTISVYLENTAATTNVKSTTWTTAVSTMSLAHTGAYTLPGTPTLAYDVTLTGAPFTYTGGGLYIAYEWSNPSNPLSTGAVIACTNQPTSPLQLLSAQNNVSLPATMAGSNFRPNTRVIAAGFANDAQSDLIYTLGSMPNTFTTNHVMQGRVTNTGNNTLTNLQVTLSISGANTFSDVQTVPSIAPCSSAMVTFLPFTPTATGTNTVSLSVPADDNNANNSKTMSQPVTNNLYSYKYVAPLSGGVGFNPGIFGVFVSKFNTAIPAQINEVKVDFQASTAGRQFRIAIYDELGGQPNTLLYSSPVVINISAAAQQAFIPISPTVTVGGNFFVGVVQETSNTANIGFSYQTENPSRFGTFFFANALSGGPWTDFGTGFPFRSAIEVQLYIPQPPNCPLLNAPADASTACINGTTLTWASGGGGPTGYRLTFGNNSPNYDNILNDVDQLSATSYVTGVLAPGTYGWKVTAYNVDGTSSGCTTRTFTTNLASCYCQPTYGSGTTAGDYISLVEIPSTTLNNVTVGAAAPYYTLFPMAGSTTGSLGTSITYNMNVAGGTFASCFVRGWIDYNQNGTFEASETIGISPNVGGPVTGSFSFTVPGGALTGTTRLRMRSSDTAPGPLDTESCGNTNSAFGETEDYDITIFTPVACSATPTPGTTAATSNPVCSGSTFTLGISATYSESGISYQWESSPNGSTWTPVSGATNPTYTTSQSSASYYHCVVTCSGFGSGTSSDLQVTMNPFYFCYCPAPHFGCGSANGEVSNVTINTLNNTTTCTGLAYASFPPSGATTTSLAKGSSYNLSVTTTVSCSTSVWFDWNQDGSFDASEHFVVSSASTANVPSVISIPIPASAQAGLTGMRIRSRLAGFQNDAGDACMAMGSGEGEDYVITVDCGGSASSNAPICDDEDLNLLGGPTGATFSWTGPASFSSGAQNPTLTGAEAGVNNGTYSVTITSPGCSQNLNTAVVINTLPAVAPTVSAAFCEGTDDLDLFANAPTATLFSWSGPGSLNNTAIANPSVLSAPASASGTYSVTVTDANSCSNTNTVNATVYALPSVAITPIGSTNICTGQTSTDLQAGGATSYLWSTGETTALITVNVQDTYTVTGTDGNGCENTDAQIISESPAPTAPIVSPAGPVVLCTDGFTTSSVMLTVTNYSDSLIWSSGETDQSITVNYQDVFNVTYTDGNGCFATSNSVSTSVDQESTDPTGASSNAPFNNICLGSTVTLTVSGGTLGDNAQWVWYDGGCGSGSPVATGASPTITPLTTGVHTYYVRSESVSCGNTACTSIAITVSPANPVGTVHYTATASVGCNGSISLFTTNSASGASFYSWNGTAGALYSTSIGGPFSPGPFQTATPSVYVQFATSPPAGASGYSICAFAGNACSNSNTICQWVRAKVTQPGVISGSGIGCPSTNGNYSIGPVTGADTYTWTITGNATINGGTNTFTGTATSVTVNFLAGYSSGTLSIYSSLNCGFNSAVRTLAISNTPAVPGTISGPSYVCPGGSASFSIVAVNGAASYNWSTTVPGAIVTPSGTSCSISFPGSIPPGSQVCVSSVSSCGSASSLRCKGIASGLPGTPGNISGPTTGNCNTTGVSFFVSSVSSAATSYLWTITGGATIQFPSNLSGVSIDFPNNFVSGIITVNGVNACGNGGTRTLAVLGAPATPVTITANPPVWCNGGFVNFSTAVPSATGYNWTVSNGTITAGQGSNNIDVTWGTGTGNVTVSASNSCGTSSIRTQSFSSGCKESQMGATIGSPVSVYPNPATSMITINFYSASSQLVNVALTDLIGRTVMQETLKTNEGANLHDVDISSLTKGVYLVQLTGASMNEVIKVTVE